MKLTVEEEAEIGRKLNKRFLAGKLSPEKIPELKRMYGNVAKELDVPLSKLMAYLEPLVKEMTEEDVIRSSSRNSKVEHTSLVEG